MAKQEAAEQKLAQVSDFVQEQKAIYSQELRESKLEIERAVWSEMIALLDRVSAVIED